MSLSPKAQALLYGCFIEPHFKDSSVSADEEFSLSVDGHAYATISDALTELLPKAGQNAEEQAFGDAKQQKEVLGWLSKSADSTAEQLDDTLKTKTFLVGNTLTAADVAVYGCQHARISKANHSELVKTPNLTRHFDLIQNSPIVTSVLATKHLFEPALVNINLDDVPAIERKVEAKKDKKPKDAENAGTSEGAKNSKKSAKIVQPETNTPSSTNKPPQTAADAPKAEGKKAKKEKAAAPPAAASAADNKPMPHMIDLRVGKIIDVKRHPDADSLYVEQIDIGEESGPRTVVSGLVNYIPIEQMQDRTLICVCNLKPAAMRGIKSFAMVLAASSKDGKSAGVELVDPPAGSKPGDRVYFEGFENEQPIEQLNPKKKIFETIQPNLTTLDSREAAWVDPTDNKAYLIRTAAGTCKAPTFVNASLS